MSKKRNYISFVLFIILLSGIALVFYKLSNERPAESPVVVMKDPDPTGLQIPLEKTVMRRVEFLRELRATDSDNQHALHMKYIDIIGANGILHEIQTLSPKCHGAGHPLGMVIYAKLGQIGPALQTCQDGCNSGCMHGVFMEAFKAEDQHEHEPGVQDDHQHNILPAVKANIPTICLTDVLSEIYKAGDCAHGVGHAIMYLVNYDVPRTMEHCMLFNTYAMQYYCATGGYMQYVTEKDQEDIKEQSLFYPCDIGEYPAACFRYKLGPIFRRHYAVEKELDEMAEKCMALEGKYRLGCFHGVGNAHMGRIVFEKVGISEVCRFGTEQDQYMCIEGAVERMGKFHPEKAWLRCQELSGWRKELCLTGAKRRMYDLDKSFKYYVQ